MALNTRGSLDPRWLTHNRAILEGGMLATIEVFNPGIGGSTYDAATNTWTSARTVLWTGKARVQPVRNAALRANMANPTSIQEVEIHIPLAADTPDIRPNDQIFIVDSPYDSSLQHYIVTVRGSVSSSNPWHKIVRCEIDQEVKRVIAAED
jgi:hypothetical protein